MLNPEDIRSRVFTATRLREGYAADEVDEFLELIYTNYENALRKIDALETELRAEQRRNNGVPTAAMPVVQQHDDEPELSVDSIKSILFAAQRTADQIKADAEQKAAELRVDGSRKSAELVADAKAEANQIVSAANMDAQGRIAELRTFESKLQQSIDTMKAERANYEAFLRQALDKFQAALEIGKENPS